MYSNSFDHKDAQQLLQERICQAQEYHASQRRMMQQLAQGLQWMGKRLITWSRRLQTEQQSWTLQGEQTTG